MHPTPSETLPVGQCATLACLLEASASKPGNVHRGADFDDLTFEDFLVGAAAIAPALEAARERGVGATVLAAVEAMRRLVGRNTHLGTILLLAPLAAVPRDRPLRAGVAEVLAELSPADARDVYAAIVRAQPGGLGEVEAMDVRGAAPPDLRVAMAAAAERDLVARQYVNGFAETFDEAAEAIAAGRAAGLSTPEAIIVAQLRLLARHGDSLIRRKCGPEFSDRVAAAAKQILEIGPPETPGFWAAVSDFDFWLRADGHRRNPGTTADLLAAGLFVLLRDGRLEPPWR